MRRRFQFTPFQLAVYGAAWIPLALLLWDLWQGHLSVNPIQDITLRTGKIAMILLVLTLTVTPLQTLLGMRQLSRVRRALGLYAFFYATLHFLTYVVLDYGLDFRLLLLELTEKRYVLVGFAAFLILAVLALTSTQAWQQRLKNNWKKLHRGIYLAAGLVMLHYIWVQKADIRQPLLWSAILLLLLILRLPPLRRWWRRQRRRVSLA